MCTEWELIVQKSENSGLFYNVAMGCMHFAQLGSLVKTLRPEVGQKS